MSARTFTAVESVARSSNAIVLAVVFLSAQVLAGRALMADDGVPTDGAAPAIQGTAATKIVTAEGGAPTSGSGTCSTGVLPHFPLQSGNEWVYQRTGSAFSDTWQVTVAERDSGGMVSLQGYFGSNHSVCSGPSGVVHEVTADTEGGDLWYDLGASVGSSWRLRLDPADGDPPACVDGSSVAIGSRSERVTVPAGTFENVIRVDFQSPCSDAGIVAEWFAPGVGLVRRVENSFAGQVVSELSRARVGGMMLPTPPLSTTLAIETNRFELASGFAPGAAAVLRGHFVFANSSNQEAAFDFTGCASISIGVIDKNGRTVIEARGDDGGNCRSDTVQHISVRSGALALPVSFELRTADGRSLDEGHYLVLATLNTLGPAPLRPTASAAFDVTSINTF